MQIDLQPGGVGESEGEQVELVGGERVERVGDRGPVRQMWVGADCALVRAQLGRTRPRCRWLSRQVHEVQEPSVAVHETSAERELPATGQRLLAAVLGESGDTACETLNPQVSELFHDATPCGLTSKSIICAGQRQGSAPAGRLKPRGMGILGVGAAYAASSTARAASSATVSRARMVRSACSRTRSMRRTRSGDSPHSFLSRPFSRSTAPRSR